jgi:anti-sigma regulatory factor (Ser/Thr protein kinase)
MNASHTVIAVSDASQVGEARRGAQRVAVQAGLNETDSGRVGIIATELATNLVRHAKGGGEVLVVARAEESACVEIVSIDRGPGMADVNRCIRDGYSTAGTPGNGLGAVRRLSSEFDIYSSAGRSAGDSAGGTVIWSRVSASAGLGKKWTSAATWGAISVAAPGETVCGDAWSLTVGEDRISVMVADGLGHGPLAAQASEAACGVFDRDRSGDPVAVFEAAHKALVSTRGAAVAVACVEPSGRRLRYSGVGNISGTLLAAGEGSRGLFSHNGTLGHLVRKFQEFEYPWAPHAVLVMHSDGLQTRWDVEKYPGLLRRHPAVIAAVLYRDFRRGRDDATVVVLAPYTGIRE